MEISNDRPRKQRHNSTVVEKDPPWPTPTPPRIRGPKAVKVDARVLLEAALVVFARDGLQQASLRAIARQAGCDPALIYYHFENKEAMFRALLEDRIPPLVEDLRRLADPADRRGAAEKCWAVLAIFHDRFQSSGGFRAMVRGELVRGAGGIRELLSVQLAGAHRAVRSILEEGLRQGQIRPGIDPFLMAFFLVRMEFEILDLVPPLAGALAGGMPSGASVPLAERTWFEVFWRGVAAHPEAFPAFLPPSDGTA